jgi:NAD(P)-dependent dehydrogenase (short-subunit alcohol dehydrogenase family)
MPIETQWCNDQMTFPTFSSLSRFEGKTAVITGAANGIGKATALMFAQAGARVALFDVDGMAATSVADDIGRAGGSATALAVDVAKEESVAAAFTATLAQFGSVDILVNNAGIAIRKSTIDLSQSDWDRVVAVNMTGVFLCARAAAREMMRSGQGGAMVNTASIFGLSGGGLYPNISYQTTKGAIINLTRALAIEWAKQGIRVNAVAPTWVRTRLIEPLLERPELVIEMTRLIPLGRLAECSEVAAAIVFLASPAAAMITGHTLPVDGGFLAQ